MTHGRFRTLCVVGLLLFSGARGCGTEDGGSTTSGSGDLQHCGEQNIVCAANQTCQNGSCISAGGAGGDAAADTGSASPGGSTAHLGTGGESTAAGAFTIRASVSPRIGTVGIVEWSVDKPVDRAYIDFGRSPESWEYRAPVDDASSTDNRTLLLGMKFGETGVTYSFQITAEGQGATYTSPIQQITTRGTNGLPRITVDRRAAVGVYEGFTIACVFGMGFIPSYTFILDKDGDHVWWYKGRVADCVRARMSYGGQHMWIANGNVPGPNRGTLVRVTMDGLTEDTYSVPFRHHDIAVLPDEAIAYIEYEGGRIGGCDLVKELDPETGDTRQIYAVSEANPGGYQPCHSNAINWWPDQNLYTVSVLNWNSILAVSRTGTLDWVIGGSRSTYSGASWSRQHNHHLLDNSIVIFNNSGSNGGSSVLEYEMNGHSAKLVFDYSSGRSTQAMGDVKRLPNGNTLVTYSNEGVIHEVGPTGELIESITAGSIGYVERRKTLYGAPPPYATE